MNDPSVSPERLAAALAGAAPPTMVDVRGPDDYAAGHVPGAVNIPADELGGRLAELPRDRPVVTY